MTQFQFRGNQFTVEIGGIDANDQVTVFNPAKGQYREYKIIGTGEINRGGIDGKYQVRTLDLQQEEIKKETLSFSAFTQESLPYFYYLTLNPGETLGSRFFKMLINGLLINEYSIGRNGIYGTDGNFYYPIAAEVQVERTDPVLVKEAIPATQDENGTEITPAQDAEYYHEGTLTVVVTDGGNDGYTYRLSGYPAQETNIFSNVPKGTYDLVVTSPLSMPCTLQVVI